ncbi:MAG: putative secreted Dyp-type peroxidase [Ilumatobacteraceae bacterium]|nr:putative secreted Dyp-type peroxidase [Ilumatobacteraceae bacterium]MCU1388382.1 putative secreted Dyp-type peroxidase [Ilumatobacteraceae bacterium]
MTGAHPAGDTPPSDQKSPTLSRRRLLGVAGATAVGGLAIGASTAAVIATRDDDHPSSGVVVPFRGAHQAGIATPAQDRLLFASYDLSATAERDDVISMLKEWTLAAERMSQGDPVGEPAASEYSPPTDTGEAEGLHPARLTITVGFGPGLFTLDGKDRFGIADRRPAALIDLPSFPRDELDPARCGGDLCVQACGDDPQVLFHAIRNLTRIARGTAVIRWSQEGFGRTSSTTSSQSTPRNLMGFKDGTDNLLSDSAEFASNVWVTGADDPGWMTDGSYLVARRIRILIENWDRSALNDQERTIGRTRDTGAPLTGTAERDVVDLDAKDASGSPVIPVDAHVRLANQDKLGIHILRRGYNFTDGLDPRVGQLDAGLFFLAYQRDPRKQFVPLQTNLAADALNEYIRHVGSAIFAIPPGARAGDWIGQTLFT